MIQKTLGTAGQEIEDHPGEGARFTALLRCGSSGRVDLGRDGVSDRSGEFGERGGDPVCRGGIDCGFVRAAAKVLQEGVHGGQRAASNLGTYSAQILVEGR
jgi:hypothetical protein